MLSAAIGIRLCSVKFHRARLSALRQVPLCLRAMLPASCWQVSDSLSQIPLHRARLSVLGQIRSSSRSMMRGF